MQYFTNGVITEASDSLPLSDLHNPLKLPLKVSAQVEDKHETPLS